MPFFIADNQTITGGLIMIGMKIVIAPFTLRRLFGGILLMSWRIETSVRADAGRNTRELSCLDRKPQFNWVGEPSNNIILHWYAIHAVMVIWSSGTAQIDCLLNYNFTPVLTLSAELNFELYEVFEVRIWFTTNISSYLLR